MANKKITADIEIQSILGHPFVTVEPIRVAYFLKRVTSIPLRCLLNFDFLVGNSDLSDEFFLCLRWFSVLSTLYAR